MDRWCQRRSAQQKQYSLYAWICLILLLVDPSEATGNNNHNKNTPLAATSAPGLTSSNNAASSSQNPISPISDATAHDEAEEIPLPVKQKKKKTKKSKELKNGDKRKSKDKSTVKQPPKPAFVTTSKTTYTSSNSKLSTTQSIFLRRVQQEWKDAVQMGLAYDWMKQKPIYSKTMKRKLKALQQTKNKSENANKSSDNDSIIPNENRIILGPLGSNLFVWNFSLVGVENSQYDGGIYHGKVVLPPNYPLTPPRVQVWTPSGRFHPLMDICLSASHFHPETWNPSAWNIRTIIESLRLHFLTPPNEIGGMSSTPDEKRQYAMASRHWKQSMLIKGKPKNDIVTIDHAKMLEQGLFANATTTATTISDEETPQIVPSTEVEEEEDIDVSMESTDNTTDNNIPDNDQPSGDAAVKAVISAVEEQPSTKETVTASVKASADAALVEAISSAEAVVKKQKKLKAAKAKKKKKKKQQVALAKKKKKQQHIQQQKLAQQQYQEPELLSQIILKSIFKKRHLRLVLLFATIYVCLFGWGRGPVGY